MITVYLTCYDGKVYQLPTLLSYQFTYTIGSPSDSYTISFLWSEGVESQLSATTRISVTWEDEVVFTGVVDEYICQLSSGGGVVELSGRGMAALLLDNEALPVDYQTATLADVVAGHVSPYGIEVVGGSQLPSVTEFSVATGSSEWQVIYEFANYYGGVQPRFDRLGRLVLSDWADTEQLVVDDSLAVTELVYCNRRYGVLSEVLVRDKVRQVVESVTNDTFVAEGGRCRRVITMPGQSDYQVMRYSGSYQLSASEVERVTLELEVPQLFYAFGGDLVRLNREGLGCNGLYRVTESKVVLDAKGGVTYLTLVLADKL